MRKLRVLALCPQGSEPPETLDGLDDRELARIKMEYDVCVAMEHLGHTIRPLGVGTDLAPIRDAIEDFKPHIAFNMIEEFHGVAIYDQHVVSFLELMRKPYTGCNPRGLLLAHDKALTKKILSYHRIGVPTFAVFRIGRAIQRPKGLTFPLLVKSTTEESSLGISLASVVYDDEQLAERVHYIHEQIYTDAIAEQYIEGRELYVGVIGNQRLDTFPIWELMFRKMPEDQPRIATAKVKWDPVYQKRHGIISRAAKNLPDGAPERIIKLCKRVYRILELSGYARMDLRLDENGRVYVIEANPNPDLSLDEDFALSAEAAGLKYEPLIQRILNLGLRYEAAWKGWT